MYKYEFKYSPELLNCLKETNMGFKQHPDIRYIVFKQQYLPFNAHTKSKA